MAGDGAALAALAQAPLAARDRLGAAAREQRLEPWLHARWGGDPALPVPLAAAWATAHRVGTLTALAQRARLLALATMLAEAGIPALALKGAWLAWHVYDAPAERPLRDLDLLVPAEALVAAQALLVAAGCREIAPSALPAAEWAARYKHMPPLVAPDGLVIEVHGRLWDDEPRLPPHPADTGALFARACVDPAEPRLRYLAPADAVMHLAVHAAAHRFDGGLLMLLDFARLDARGAADWASLWPRARAEGWDRALALALAATDRWLRPGLLAAAACRLTVPAAVLEGVPALAARGGAARAGDHAVRKLAAGRRWARVWDRRRHFFARSEWLAWIAGEARGVLAARRSDPAQALRQAALDDWLTAG